MLDKRKRQRMDNEYSIYKVVQQSSSGISAVNIAKKLEKPDDYRTTVHRYLTSLESQGKVRNEHGEWFPINEQQVKASIDIELRQRIFKEVDEIKEVLFSRFPSPTQAFDKMRWLIAQLPPNFKEKLRPREKEIMFHREEYKKYDDFCYEATIQLLSALNDVLYGESSS